MCQLKVLLACQLIVHSFNQLQDLQKKKKKKKEKFPGTMLDSAVTLLHLTVHLDKLIVNIFCYCRHVLKNVIGFLSTALIDIPHKS